MGDYDKIINEEEEYEAEDADDLKEQENPKEFEDPQGENTAVREMEEEEVEGRVDFSYAKKNKKAKKTKPATAKKKTKKAKKAKKAKKTTKAGKAKKRK